MAAQGVWVTLKELASLSGKMDYHFKIVGDGKHCNELEQLAKELDIMNRIYFLGSRRDIPCGSMIQKLAVGVKLDILNVDYEFMKYSQKLIFDLVLYFCSPISGNSASKEIFGLTAQIEAVYKRYHSDEYTQMAENTRVKAQMFDNRLKNIF